MTDRIDFGGQPWHAIPRALLRDERLSPRAKGGLVTLLSHEEGWVRSAIATLMKEADCGRDQATSIMRDLEKLGYAVREQKHKPDGTFTTFYTTYAVPVSSDPSTSGSPPTGSPVTVQPSTVPPLTVVEALDVEPLDVEPPEVQGLALRAKNGRKRTLNDDLWDALGAFLEVQPSNAGVRGKWARGVALLVESGVAAPDVAGLCEMYLRTFPGMDLNPMALAMHVDELRRNVDHGGPPKRRNGAVAMLAGMKPSNGVSDGYRNGEGDL